MWVFCRLLLLVAGILLVNFPLAVRHGEFAAPMSVAVEGLSEREMRDVRLVIVELDEVRCIAPTTPGSWDCGQRCIAEVLLQFPEPLVNSAATVRIMIGDESFTIPLQELAWRQGCHWPPAHIALGGAPVFAPCRNWPGNHVFLRHYLTRCAPGLIFVLLLAMATGFVLRTPWRNNLLSILGLTEPQPIAGASAAVSNQRFWNCVGWVGLIGGFIGLEWMQPYYFTQDDVLIGELPVALLACRSLWIGTFPDWNPYVFLGAPLASMGFSSITYPPLPAAYAIARHLLGDEGATMEVFAALHLLAGFIAQRMLCRRIGMGAFTANLAALSFVFAGCILIMGRSWHFFIALAVWLPLLGLAIERFRTGPVGWAWIIGVGLLLGSAYHAGFPQIVTILGMFLCIALAAVAFGDRLPLIRVAPLIPAVLLGIGLSAPLLLQQLQMTTGHERGAPSALGLHDRLHAALLPYPLVQADLPIQLGSVHVEKMGHFYFFGGLFALLFAWQVVCFWAYWPDRRTWARSWWIPFGIVALLLVLGEPAFLWKGLAELPMSKFYLRYPKRFYPCLAFSAILAGGLILERILAAVRRRSIWEYGVGTLMLGVLAHHLAMCQPSFYTYGFRPYPELPREFEAVFHPYAHKEMVGVKNSRRVASWAQVHSIAPDYYLSLPMNLPLQYQVPSVFGYDPIIEGQPRMAEVYRRLEDDPAAACKAYGIGWHLCSYSDSPVFSPNKRCWSMEQMVNANLTYRRLPKADMKAVAEADGTTLMELPGVDPLAFASASPGRPLPMRLHCGGADVDVSGLPAGTRVTINFLRYPHMTCALDGEAAAVDADDWHRVTTILPHQGTTLTLRFEPPWLRSCAGGAGLCAVAFLLAWLLLRRKCEPSFQ